MEFKHTSAHGKIALLDKLLECKLNAQEYMNYESILKNLTDLIDRLGQANSSIGHALVGIENGFDNNVILIVIENKDNYTLYTWARKEIIERPLSFTVYSEDYSEDTNELIAEAKTNTPLSKEEVVSLMLTQNLTGYSLNNLKIKEYIEFSKSGAEPTKIEEQTPLTKELAKIMQSIKKANKSEKEKAINTISNFVNKQECDTLNLALNTGGLITSSMLVGKITDVRQVGNNRHYKLEYIEREGAKGTKTGSVVASVHPGKYRALTVKKLGEIYIADCGRRYYGDNGEINKENLTDIPYNYVDVGRYFVGIRRTENSWKLIIGGDPRVDVDHLETLSSVFSRYAKHSITQDIDLTGTEIKEGDTVFDYKSYESRLKSDLSAEEIKQKGIRLQLQALQKMVSEYKYIVKKHKSVGKDVYITDKVIYNHAEGKISYGDFSIATSDELMKAKLYDKFEKYLVDFYRGTLTEENILNGLLDSFFTELGERIIQVTGDGFENTITINGCTEVELKVAKTSRGASLVYLNGQRFNRNEVLVVLREITCYRDSVEAKRFIANVGKLGLSVYIGVTTGFEIETSDGNKIYKFRKEKGRSNYKLLLDDLELNLKGKKVISHLYSKFIGDQPSNFLDKLQKLMFDSVNSSLDYLKYKFLIDSSYESFKEKSRKFLDKKVEDVEGEYCIYLPERKKKPLEAVKLTGLSGNEYIVAFDAKESFVFISPQKKEENEYYSDGKYICMVDQSNIKSNIGYDTVISKLMALRNDSLIAGTIYNLDEELSNG